MTDISRSHIEQILNAAAVNYEFRDAASIRLRLAELKTAVQRTGNEGEANLLWGLQTVLEAQEEYQTAILRCKERRFYSAWCSLERAEVECKHLLNSFPSWRGKYHIGFIELQTKRIQDLFPYRLFASTGMRVMERKCSICDRTLTIRNRCEHVKGKLYNGEMCCHVISKFDILEISMVENPVHRYAVTFLSAPDGSRHDHYNYAVVDYVIRGLRSPYDSFGVTMRYRRLGRDVLDRCGRNSKCPCGSGRKFKNCCIDAQSIDVPHQDVVFEKNPPEGLPRMVEQPVVVRGQLD